jgi:ATP-dependent helicase HrpA
VPLEQADFAALVQYVRGSLGATMADVVRLVEQILTVSHSVDAAVESAENELAKADAQAQLKALLHAGFVSEAGIQRLPDVLRYLRAVEQRLQKLSLDPVRDADRTVEIGELAAAYRQLLRMLPPGAADDPVVLEIRWMLEELRVSFFAQGLRTKYPVSPQRVYRAIDALVAAPGTVEV